MRELRKRGGTCERLSSVLTARQCSRPGGCGCYRRGIWSGRRGVRGRPHHAADRRDRRPAELRQPVLHAEPQQVPVWRVYQCFDRVHHPRGGDLLLRGRAVQQTDGPLQAAAGAGAGAHLPVLPEQRESSRDPLSVLHLATGGGGGAGLVCHPLRISGEAGHLNGARRAFGGSCSTPCASTIVLSLRYEFGARRKYGMELPADLRAALEIELGNVSPRKIAPAARDLSRRYRDRHGRAKASLLQGTGDVAAYAAYRMPATYAAVRAVLNEVRDRRPDLAPRTLLDLGSGPGTAAWAAVETWSSLERITILERDVRMIELGKRLAAHSENTVLHDAG